MSTVVPVHGKTADSIGKHWKHGKNIDSVSDSVVRAQIFIRSFASSSRVWRWEVAVLFFNLQFACHIGKCFGYSLPLPCLGPHWFPRSWFAPAPVPGPHWFPGPGLPLPPLVPPGPHWIPPLPTGSPGPGLFYVTVAPICDAH